MRTTPVRAVRSPAGPLQRVGGVEHDRRHVLHHVHPKHIDDKIVIAEGGTPFAQDDAVVARFPAFGDDVAHFMRRQKLRFLDVYRRSGLRHGNDQVSLPREKGRQLDDIGHFGGGCGLIRLMDVRQNGHAVTRFDIRQHAQSASRPGPRKDEIDDRFALSNDALKT